MDSDQWASLYEQERSKRLQVEESYSAVVDDYSSLMNEYIDLFFYLQEGRVPLMFAVDDAVGMYLIS